MLTYILTTPNLNVMGHRWVGALASYTLFQKRDALLKKYLGDYAETEEG